MSRLTLLPVLFALLSGCTTPGPVDQVVVEPRGEFAQIRVASQNEIFARLLKDDPAAVERVIAEPGDYNPPVLHALSHALFDADRRDEATFWFYLGQLRARSDADKALDPSARRAVDALNQRFGARINQYAFQDTDRLRATIDDVLASDRRIDRHYDPRWIALHGIEAIDGTRVHFAPRERWLEIDAATRRTYLAGFERAIDSLP